MLAEQVIEILDEHGIKASKVNDHCINFGEYGACMIGHLSFGALAWDIISHNDLRMGTFSDEDTLLEILQTHNLF